MHRLSKCELFFSNRWTLQSNVKLYQNLKQKKSQFFIISAVIMVSILVSIAQYIFDYAKVDLTKPGEIQELEYISVIKDSLYSTAKVSQDCNRLDAELKETENFLSKVLAEQGIDLSIKHNIVSCSLVTFSFNITSPNFFSKTEFQYP